MLLLQLVLVLQDNIRDLLKKLTERFPVARGECKKLWLFERELSVRQHEIFYRKLREDEIPLELNLIWCANQERKSIIFTDHDPNELKYQHLSVQQVNQFSIFCACKLSQFNI